MIARRALDQLPDINPIMSRQEAGDRFPQHRLRDLCIAWQCGSTNFLLVADELSHEAQESRTLLHDYLPCFTWCSCRKAGSRTRGQEGSATQLTWIRDPVLVSRTGSDTTMLAMQLRCSGSILGCHKFGPSTHSTSCFVQNCRRATNLCNHIEHLGWGHGHGHGHASACSHSFRRAPLHVRRMSPCLHRSRSSPAGSTVSCTVTMPSNVVSESKQFSRVAGLCCACHNMPATHSDASSRNETHDEAKRALSQEPEKVRLRLTLLAEQRLGCLLRMKTDCEDATCIIKFLCSTWSFSWRHAVSGNPFVLNCGLVHLGTRLVCFGRCRIHPLCFLA